MRAWDLGGGPPKPVIQAVGSPLSSLNVPRTVPTVRSLRAARGVVVAERGSASRGIACRGPTRGLGGLDEVSEEAGNVVGLGDEGEQAHAAAAPWAGLDVDAEGSAEQLGPGAVARRAGLSRRIGVGSSVLIRVVAR